MGNENRLMHPATQLPLARLAAPVRSEWDSKVQLIVTAAYDSQFRHDLAEPNPQQRYSLHYEGRSIDLITLPTAGMAGYAHWRCTPASIGYTTKSTTATHRSAPTACAPSAVP